MSSTLRWRPTHTSGNDLPYELKRALHKRTDGEPVKGEFTEASIQYLQGLRDGGVVGADKLIEAIEKHGSVEVWEEF